MTDRLQEVLFQFGMTCAAQPAAKLAQRLGLPTSSTTILRQIKAHPLPREQPARVVGVDDWAWKKGQRYGSLIVDLERHRVIMVQPKRSSAAISQWLATHPQVEIVSRDRGTVYIEGVSAGAPHAQQVADRFHLLLNARETLTAFLAGHRKDLSLTAELTTSATAKHDVVRRVAEQQERVEQIYALREQGVRRAEIARRTGLSLRSISRSFQVATWRQYGRAWKSAPEPYLAYLRQRFNEGCHNASLLYREIQQQGYAGTYPTVALYLRHLKTEEGTALPARTRQGFAPATIAWWMLSEQRTAEQERVVQQIVATHPHIQRAYLLVRQFYALVRQHEGLLFSPWLQEMEESGFPVLMRWARGLRQDASAVRAGIDGPWSNGMVEGFINRLKTLKRQMYGRASLALLERRLLLSSEG